MLNKDHTFGEITQQYLGVVELSRVLTTLISVYSRLHSLIWGSCLGS
jgi:hypothetical protein